MKLTAVEWYAREEAQLAVDWYNKKITASQFVEKKLNLVEQAKQMQEQQRKESYIEGIIQGIKFAVHEWGEEKGGAK